MGIGDFFSKIGSGISDAFSGMKNVGKGFFEGITGIGDRLKGAAQRVGQGINQVARFGQNIRDRIVEPVANRIASLPYIGDSLKKIYENSPIKAMYEKGSKQLDSIERISDATARGEFRDALKETMKNPLVREQVAKYQDKINMLPAPVRDEINNFLSDPADGDRVMEIVKRMRR
jgi:hypothetical protein